MKTKKRIWFNLISALMIVCICVTGFVGCGGEKSNDKSYNSSYDSDASISRSKAISIAQGSSTVQNKIAALWDMKFFYTPDWGTCTAEKQSNGDWEVVLKGNISGYTDDYKDDFIYNNKFKVKVTVSSTGRVGYVYASREY